MWERVVCILLSAIVMMSVSHIVLAASDDIFPRAPLPSRDLVVARVSGKPFDLQLALVSLQGLVNREKPQVYLLWDSRDLSWLEKMYDQDIINMPDFLDEPEMLFEKFRNDIKGLVVYDPDRLFTVNVATVVSACEDLIIASPRLAEQLGANIIVDLRDRWEYEVDGYRWAWETYKSEVSSQALAILYPTTFDGRARDYLIANKIFIFWVSGPEEPSRPGMNSLKEKAFAEEVFASTPPNIPLIWLVLVFGLLGVFVLGFARLRAEGGIPTERMMCDTYHFSVIQAIVGLEAMGGKSSAGLNFFIPFSQGAFTSLGAITQEAAHTADAMKISKRVMTRGLMIASNSYCMALRDV